MNRIFPHVTDRLRRFFQRSDVPSPDEADLHITRATVEKLTGHPAGALALYAQALTHRSVLRSAEEASPLRSNERLEFLGDAILGSIVADALFRQFPKQDEGYLTRLRSRLVSGKALAGSAQALGLGTHLHLSDNLDRAGGRANRTVLSDAFEALIGALYLDQGFEAARAFVERTVLKGASRAGESLADVAARQENYKSLLLEYVQARGETPPQYRTTGADGPAHDRVFTVEVLIGGEAHGTGTAGSKKTAEQQAAGEALRALRAEDADSTMQ